MIWIILFTLLIISVIGIIKGFLRKLFGTLLFLTIIIFGLYLNHQNITSIPEAFNHLYKLGKTVADNSSENPESNLPEHFVYKLSGSETSTTSDPAVQYGATLLFGELDHGRAVWGHILVSDAQEPGTNRIKRPESTPKPNIWHQKKTNGKYIYDSSHLIGWQFSGSNDVRNLVQGTSYLNRGVMGPGSDESNHESMLYYEQQLDSWLALHPNYVLDYYVKAIYEGSDHIPNKIYMQWVGVDQNGETIPIQIGGHSYNAYKDYHAVILENKIP